MTLLSDPSLTPEPGAGATPPLEATADAAPRRGPKPAVAGTKQHGEQALLWLFVVVPFLAVLAAIPFAWGWGISWTDVVLSVVFFAFGGLGITVGYHRYFTHGAFKANRGLKIALGVMGSFAIEGPVTRWVADHRRHHAFSDREGDPHSPWRYGETVPALARGLAWAHVGWMFDEMHTNRERFVPDLLRDDDIRRVDKLFPVWVLLSLGLPPLIGGLVSMSWTGALTAFFWASLVRVFVLHHVTWSINSICHTIGERPFAARDRSANFWPLAVFSFGESWHNSHHADPTCARHGVLKGQWDSSARLIALFEWFGWARDVRWPRAERLEKLRASTD